MTASNENIKRTFQQLHDAAIACFTKPKRKPKPKPYALGMAISFITTALAITQQLASAGRLTNKLKKAQEDVVADAIRQGELKISTLYQSQKAADVYRHLRNCFAHVNWSYDEANISKANLEIKLGDYRKRKKKVVPTFEATIELPAIVNLAEKLLVTTFNGID